MGIPETIDRFCEKTRHVPRDGTSVSERRRRREMGEDQQIVHFERPFRTDEVGGRVPMDLRRDRPRPALDAHKEKMSRSVDSPSIGFLNGQIQVGDLISSKAEDELQKDLVK